MRDPLTCLLLALALLIFPVSAAFGQQDALQAASQVGDAVAIREALAAGASVNQIDENGFTPILNATLRGHAQAVVVLLAAGADPNIANEDGATPLMGAAINGNSEIARLLLVAGADPAARNRSGATAETKAAEYGHSELAEYLSGLTPKALRAAEPARRPTELHESVPTPQVSEPIAPVPAPSVNEPPPAATVPSVSEPPPAATTPPASEPPPVATAPPASEAPPVATAPPIESFRIRYVVLKGSVLREAPDTAAPVSGSLAPGTEIWVTGKVLDRNWYRIGAGATESYIYGSVIEPLEEETSVPSVEAPTSTQPSR